MIVLLVRTDGRDELLRRTIDSMQQNVIGSISRIVIHDDTGDTDHNAMLQREYPAWDVISGPRAGFGGAIQRAWSVIAREYDRCDYIFDLEDDFTFNRPVDLNEMAKVLDEFPHVQQIALMRQAWNDKERRAGGLLQSIEEHLTETRWSGLHWMEHRLFWTTNPSLYRTSLISRGWPEVEHSEGHFGISLMDEHPDNCFAFWGRKEDSPWVRHIGEHRVGTGY